MAATATATAAALVLAGCGGGEVQEDLFLVVRTGTVPGAHLSMLVNDAGLVTCNGKQHELPSKRLLDARQLQRDVMPYAQRNLHLVAQPGSVFAYSMRDQDGTIAFSDNSRGLPPKLAGLPLFVLEVARQVCHLPR
jgi:hypothetical protein